MHTVFIRTNNKQIIGAHVSQYSILKNASEPTEVRYINVDEIPLFQGFHGKQFFRYGEKITYDKKDLQSFTLAAFMPPELMNYQGRAVVIDPDVFSCVDIVELFKTDLQGHALAARPKRGAWDTSVMLLDCSRLHHWDIEKILRQLANGQADYGDWMSLKNEDALDLPPNWNDWDHLDEKTKLLHTTKRITQPWKTGLPVDFHINPMGRVFGIVSRRWLLQFLGRLPRRYQPHPDKSIETFFFRLLKDALRDGAVAEHQVREAISAGHIRVDTLEMLTKIS